MPWAGTLVKSLPAMSIVALLAIVILPETATALIVSIEPEVRFRFGKPSVLWVAMSTPPELTEILEEPAW